MSNHEERDEEIPQLEYPTGEENNPPEKKIDPPLEDVKKNLSAYIITAAFAAISVLFGSLYASQKQQYETARKDLVELKNDSRKERKSDSTVIASLRIALDNCDDVTLEDLERKIEQAQRLKLAATSDYSKINKEIAIAQENARELDKATKAVKKALETKK